jgi:AcrR family transcriptional regulator
MARGTAEPLETGNEPDRFVAAGLRVLAENGPADLTVRRIAEAAGSSTMGIYTRFGGRAGILEAIYRHGFDVLRDALAAVPADANGSGGTNGSGADRIVNLGRACRGFALANPSLYALMFERPVAGFDPAPEVRQEALRITFGLLVAAVQRAIDGGEVRAGDPARTAYLLWCVVHGTVSLELTHALRRPLPGWFIDTPGSGEEVLVDGVRATLAGLRPDD